MGELDFWEDFGGSGKKFKGVFFFFLYLKNILDIHDIISADIFGQSPVTTA